MDQERAEEISTFLFLVGIDNYQHQRVPPLQGCVNDVDLFSTYITSQFHVPESNIFRLINAQATRRNIIARFRADLIENLAIAPGDRLIIFFSGHGGLVPAPPGWTTDTKEIESFCPSDIGTRDDKNRRIPSIPDITLHILFRWLIQAKGKNITAIFDCCHSAGLSRGGEGGRDASQFSKSIELGDFDKDIRSAYFRGGGPKCSSVHRLHDVPCAMMFACRKEQTAREMLIHGKYHGRFTHYLVEHLKQPFGLDMSPQAIIQSISPRVNGDHNRQTPWADGQVTNSYIFSPQELPRDSPTKLRQLTTRRVDMFQVDAGPEHGLETGANVDVRHVLQGIIGKLRVEDAAHPGGAILENLPHAQTQIPFGGEGDMEIIIPRPEMKVFFHSTPIPCSPSPYDHIRVTTQAHLADVVITKTNQKSGMEYLLTPTELWFDGVKSFKVMLTPGTTIWSKIHHIHHFRSELVRICPVPAWLKTSPGPESPNTQAAASSAGHSDKIMVKLYRLVYDAYIDLPTPETWVDLLEGRNHVEVSCDSEDMYGIEIVQNIGQSMFIYLVAFNALDLEIQTFRREMMPVDAGQSVRIGWGDGGNDPVHFSVAEDLNQETVYFKVIVTSHWQDPSLWEKEPILPPSGTAKGVIQGPVSRVGRRRVCGTRITAVTVKKSPQA